MKILLALFLAASMSSTAIAQTTIPTSAPVVPSQTVKVTIPAQTITIPAQVISVAIPAQTLAPLTTTLSGMQLSISCPKGTYTMAANGTMTTNLGSCTVTVTKP